MTTQLATIPFQIIGILKSHNFANSAFCPQCHKPFVRIYCDIKGCRLYCTICYWEENYKRIEKNI